MGALLLPPLESVIAAGTVLQHVSREAYRGQPLHFGKGGQHRYDDPAKGYGVLYLAFNLSTALMESVFHKHRWHTGGRRKITLSEVQSRMVRAVKVLGDVTLCDLASDGAAVRAFGLNATQLSARRYAGTRALSAQIAALSSASGAPFDGILYPSHNNPGAQCIALFDHAAARVAVTDDIQLADHRDWPEFVRYFGVAILPR